MRANVWQRIRIANRGREPERLRRKFQKLATNAFMFFRGTAHLFHEDFPSDLDIGLPTWLCGDLHLENFGSFKGANGLTYYDVNDFDEAVLASPLRDLARYVTSIAVRYGPSRVDAASRLGTEFLGAYRAALLSGTPGWIERATATGEVRRLLQQVKRRGRRAVLERYTEPTGRLRRIKIRPGHSLRVTRSERRMVAALIDRARACRTRRATEVVDVAGRVIGTGSLGVPRWIVLARRLERKPDYVLLDVKQALRPCAAIHVRERQPRWPSEAARVVGVQRRMQAAAPRRLCAVMSGGRSFVVRSLQPSADKLEVNNDDLEAMADLVRSAGEIVAWNQLRSSGRSGSATADELIAWARSQGWPHATLAYALKYSQTVHADWEAFAARGRGHRRNH